MSTEPEAEPHPDRDMTDSELDTAYKGLTNATEFWVVAGRSRIAFRFGPYTPHEAGALMTEAVERKIAVTIIGQCGRGFDWQLADDLGCWLPGHPPRPPETPAGDSQS